MTNDSSCIKTYIIYIVLLFVIPTSLIAENLSFLLFSKVQYRFYAFLKKGRKLL